MSDPTPLLVLMDTPHLRRGAQRLDLPDTLPGYLVALLARAGDWVPREWLATLCWPEAAQAGAQHNLSVNLNRLRPLLQAWGVDDALRAERRRVRLDLDTDVAQLRRAHARADWPAAAALPAAPFLQGLSFRAFAAVEEWARVERAALLADWRMALLRAAQQLTPAQLLTVATRWLQAEPLDEPGVLLQLGALVALDRRDEARRLAAQFEDRCSTELGRPPGTAYAAQKPRLLGDATTGPRRALPAGPLQPRRLVGREAASARLQSADTRVVCIAGDPGMGKTRLLEEHWAGACWLRCRPGTADVALAPLADYLDDHREALPPLVGPLLELARLVPTLAGEPPPAAAPTPGDEAQLLAAAAELLEAQGGGVVLDDLQWADELSCRLALTLARRGRVRLALTCRLRETDGHAAATVAALVADHGACEIALQALDEGACAALLRALDPAAQGLGASPAWLCRRSAGNPWFAIELLRSLFERGELDAAAPGWTAALAQRVAEQADSEIPPRLADLTRQRLAGLTETARRLLGVAAVAGRATPVQALADAAGLSPWAAAEAVAEAGRAGVLDGERFAHDLLRESLLAATPAPLLRHMHAQVARALAHVLAPEQRAAHCWAADDAPGALAATHAAVEAARARGLHAQALVLVAQTLPRAGSSAARAGLLADAALLRLELADVQAAEHDARAALAEAALPADRARALTVLGRRATQQGDLATGAQWAAEAAQAQPEDLDVLSLQDDIAMARGQAAERLAPLRTRLQALRRQPPGASLISTLTSLGAVHDELDESEAGYPLHAEALALARQLKARHAQVLVAINMAWCCAALPGRREEGMAVAEEALALGETDATPVLRNNLAWIYRDVGRLDDALALYGQLADGPDPTLACIAQAWCAQLLAGRSAPPALVVQALDKAIGLMEHTDYYTAHALVVVAALQHGAIQQQLQVLPWLQPGQPLDSSLQERLDAALALRKVSLTPAG